MWSKIRRVGSRLCLITGTLAVISFSSGAPAQAQNSYTAFVSAITALAASANDLITNQRNAARREYIRQQVTDKILTAFPVAGTAPSSTTIKLDDVLDPNTLLCRFRSTKQWTIVKSISARDKDASITIDQLATVTEQNYLTGAVRQLNAAVTPANTSDLISALKVLFAPPPPTAPDAPQKLSVPDKTRSSVEASCEQDLVEFEAAYYGKPIPSPPVAGPVPAAAAAPAIPDLSFLGPIGSAINAAIGIITPVIESFAAIEANFAAKQKVQAILTNDQQPLTDGGRSLGRTVSDYLFAKRLALAGEFSEQIAVIQADSMDLTTKDVEAACPYKTMYARGANGKGPLNPEFMRCYSAIWVHFEKEVDAALQTALAYDQIADVGNTSTALNKYTQMTTAPNYQKIINEGFQSNDEFWTDVTLLATFAGAISTAVSADNQKKLEQAIKAVTSR
jgi:hypothetical protein